MHSHRNQGKQPRTRLNGLMMRTLTLLSLSLLRRFHFVLDAILPDFVSRSLESFIVADSRSRMLNLEQWPPRDSRRNVRIPNYEPAPGQGLYYESMMKLPFELLSSQIQQASNYLPIGPEPEAASQMVQRKMKELTERGIEED